MAFNYYPNYNSNYLPNYQMNNQTIQNSGFVTVQSEEEARTYPLAHGMSVMFRDENSPYIYSKTLGFGQLDIPVFERYRLIKEPYQTAQKPSEENKAEEISYVTKDEFDPFKSEIKTIKEMVEKLRRDLGDEHI